MATVQEQKYKNKGKEFARYFISLEKTIVEQLGLKKGDKLHFNGEMGGELRFKLVRK
jgi:hypothetical protein